MKGLEQAIRKALGKGNAEDEAFRQRVYQSAFAALEKAVRDSGLPPDAIEMRRARLRNRIGIIESEFAPALPRIEPEPRAVRGRSAAPTLDGEERRRPEPVRPARTRRSWGLRNLLLVAGLVFAAIVVGAWWSLQTGLFLSPQARDTAEPAAPRSERAARPVAGGDIPPVQDWITIFDPGEPEAVNVPSGALAEIVEEEGVPFLRLQAGGETAIRFEVGQGTLERLAGKTALFSLLARAEQPAQISVSCDFGTLGDCGRKRYEVGPVPGEFLFEVQIPAGRPASAGTILINPDIEGSGTPVDVRTIRVSATG